MKSAFSRNVLDFSFKFKFSFTQKIMSLINFARELSECEPMLFRKTNKLSFDCDVVEHKDKYEVVAELPGVSKEDINVDLHHQTLKIEVEKKEEKKSEGAEYRSVERRFGKAARSFYLPNDADSANCKASFENGILKLDIPKLAKSVGTRLEIQ